MKKNTLLMISLFAIPVLLLGACGAQPTATPETVEEVLTSDEVVAEGRLEPIRGTNLTFQARGDRKSVV